MRLQYGDKQVTMVVCGFYFVRMGGVGFMKKHSFFNVQTYFLVYREYLFRKSR